MSTLKFILDAHGEPVVEPDLLTWARWFETANRIVRQDTIGTAKVSTVFLGLDHNFFPDDDAAPVLWESMIFGGPLDQEQRRYTSKAEALVGHEELCALVRMEIAAAQESHQG